MQVVPLVTVSRDLTDPQPSPFSVFHFPVVVLRFSSIFVRGFFLFFVAEFFNSVVTRRTLLFYSIHEDFCFGFHRHIRDLQLQFRFRNSIFIGGPWGDLSHSGSKLQVRVSNWEWFCAQNASILWQSMNLGIWRKCLYRLWDRWNFLHRIFSPSRRDSPGKCRRRVVATWRPRMAGMKRSRRTVRASPMTMRMKRRRPRTKTPAGVPKMTPFSSRLPVGLPRLIETSDGINSPRSLRLKKTVKSAEKCWKIAGKKSNLGFLVQPLFIWLIDWFVRFSPN